MLIIGLLVGVVLLVLLFVLVFSLSFFNLFHILTSAFLFGGFPLFAVLVIIEYFFLKGVVKEVKRKGVPADLPPSLINRRFISDLFFLLLITIVLIFGDRLVQYLILKKSLNSLFTVTSLRSIYFSGSFIFPIYFVYATFISLFVFFKKKGLLNFIKNKVFPLILLIVLIIASVFFRWDISSNMIETVINPVIRGKYFEKNIDRIKDPRLNSLYNLRAGESYVISAIRHNEKLEAAKGWNYLQKVEHKKYKNSLEYYKITLLAARILDKEKEIINSYDLIFKAYKRLPYSILNNFLNDTLNFKKPPFEKILDVVENNSEQLKNDKEINEAYNFIRSNLETDQTGLIKYYNAKKEKRPERKIALLHEIIESDTEYLIKDDAYFYYIDVLADSKQKRTAYSELINFLTLYPDSTYMKQVDKIKEKIKYTTISNSVLKGKDELFNISTRIDNDFYIASNNSIYQFFPNNFSLNNLFSFNKQENDNVAKIIPLDKYFWIFYYGGRVDMLNLITRDRKLLIQPSASSYVNPSISVDRNLYIGTMQGIYKYTNDGKKTKMITKSNGLISSKIYYLDKKGSTLYIGTDNSFILYNETKMQPILQKGYQDIITHSKFSNYQYINKISNNIYALADLGFVSYSLARKMWNKPLALGQLKFFDYDKNYLVFLLKQQDKKNGYSLYIFGRNTGKKIKEIYDIPLGPPYTLLRLTGGSIFLANGERKVLRISLNTWNMEKFKGEVEMGDIINLEIADNYLIMLQPKCIKLVDLGVK